MRAVGAITACFPYVDEETRNILQAAMDEAKDLNDFGEILCNKVCTESVNELTIYFAYNFVRVNWTLLDRLQEAGKFSVLAKPIILNNSRRRVTGIEWSDCQKAIADALKASPNDWIACHIYLGWRGIAEGSQLFTECSTDSGVMGVLEAKIEEDDEFSFFLSQLYQIRANRLAKERSIDEAIKMYDQVLLLSESHDNYEDVISALNKKVNLVKRTDIDEAIALLDVHRKICEENGLIEGLANNHHQLGHIAMARGDFNTAIYHQNKRNQIGFQLGWPESGFAPRIAMLYNMMGDGAKALKLITGMKRNLLHISVFPLSLIQESWAMVNLGKIREAEKIISEAKNRILKSDDEVRLGLVYLVEGLIEKLRRDFVSAEFTIQRALDIFERYLSQAFISNALVHLCDIEIETFQYGALDKIVNLSGPWMQKLIDKVEKNGLPGFEAQLKIMEAKFLFKQTDVVQSKKLIQEVLILSESSKMKYLEGMAKLLLPELVP